MKQYSVIPSKHYPIEKTIFWLSMKIYKYMPPKILVDELFEKYVSNNYEFIDFDNYILILDFLFLVGKIEEKNGWLYKL